MRPETTGINLLHYYSSQTAREVGERGEDSFLLEPQELTLWILGASLDECSQEALVIEMGKMIAVANRSQLFRQKFVETLEELGEKNYKKLVKWIPALKNFHPLPQRDIPHEIIEKNMPSIYFQNNIRLEDKNGFNPIGKKKKCDYPEINSLFHFPLSLGHSQQRRKEIAKAQQRLGLTLEKLTTKKERKNYLDRAIPDTQNLTTYVQNLSRWFRDLQELRGNVRELVVVQMMDPDLLLGLDSLLSEAEAWLLTSRSFENKRYNHPIRSDSDLQNFFTLLSQAEGLGPNVVPSVKGRFEKVVDLDWLANALVKNPTFVSRFQNFYFSSPFSTKLAQKIVERLAIPQSPTEFQKWRELIKGFHDHYMFSLGNALENTLLEKADLAKIIPADVKADLKKFTDTSKLAAWLKKMGPITEGLRNRELCKRLLETAFGGPIELLSVFQLQDPSIPIAMDKMEELRKLVNEALASNDGDRFVFNFMVSRLREPITWKNFNRRMQLASDLWNYSTYDNNINEMYRTLARFHASRLGQFIEKHQEELDRHLSKTDQERHLDFLSSCGVHIAFKTSALQKTWSNLKQGRVGYILQKAIDKANRQIFDADRYEKGRYQYQKKQNLRPGFTLEELTLNGKKVATIIRGHPEQGARINYEVGIGGRVTTDYLSRQYGDRYAASAVAGYSMEGMKPAELAIVDGQVENYIATATQMGMAVVTQDQELSIVDLNDFRLPGRNRPLQIVADGSDFVRFTDWCFQNSCDAFQGHTLVYDGQNKVDSQMSDAAKDKRRVLASFKDGSFAIVHFEEGLTLYEAAYLALQIPGLQSAINLDTGMYDIADYRDARGEVIDLATDDPQRKDTATNKIVFFTQ